MPEGKLYVVGEEILREFRALQQWARNLRITGPGVTCRNDPSGFTATFGGGRPPPPPPPPPRPIFLRITGYERDGDNFRWTYDVEQVEKTSAGYGGWEAVEGGITGKGYNLIENGNFDEGLFGNGVDSENLEETGLEVQPAPEGTVVVLAAAVWVEPESESEDGSEYWFAYENGVDGPCEPPEEE